MEENTTLEQPVISDSEGSVIEQNSTEEKVQIQSEKTGSIFGKFKDAETLLNAYNSLEKEFTRKSQQLAKLKEQTSNLALSDKDNIAVENNIDTEQNSEKLEIKTNIQTAKLSISDDDWKTLKESFLAKNPEAKQYSKEISQFLIENKDFLKSPNCLEYAYTIIKQKNQARPEDLLNDQTFVKEKIMTNQSIKDEIIKEYLNSLTTGNQMPKFISGTTQSISVTRPDNKPKTIKEASMMLKKLLQ